MVVRQHWRSAVVEAEFYANSELNSLSLVDIEPPVDLVDMSDMLGASVEYMRARSDRLGALCYMNGKWVVRLESGSWLSKSNERFIVAHELAHLLMLRHGVFRPASEQEYWILEETCDRLATRLLVPVDRGPQGILHPSEIETWFSELIECWELSSVDAARMICERSVNCMSTAFLEDYADGMSVKWSYSRRGSLPWVQSTRVDDCLSLLSPELAWRRERTVEVRVFGGTLLGFWWLDSPAGSARQMQLDLLDSIDAHVRYDGVAVAFVLGDLGHDGQLELPLGAP